MTNTYSIAQRLNCAVDTELAQGKGLLQERGQDPDLGTSDLPYDFPSQKSTQLFSKMLLGQLLETLEANPAVTTGGPS